MNKTFDDHLEQIVTDHIVHTKATEIASNLAKQLERYEHVRDVRAQVLTDSNGSNAGSTTIDLSFVKMLSADHINITFKASK